MEYSDNSAPFDDFSNELDSQYLMEPNEGIMEDAEDAVATYPLGMINYQRQMKYICTYIPSEFNYLEIPIRNHIFY